MIHSFSLDNYARSGDWLYARVLGNSIKLAFLTMISCLALAYPMAYVMATASKSLRQFLMILIVIPFWSNLVLRAYAIRFLLGRTGPLSQLLVAVGLFHEPVALSDGNLAVWFGMLTNYLPFMVLPLYVTLEKFDFTLFEAAKDLGASSWHLLGRVLLPITKKGIVTGCILVFVPALGEFVIPELLGGARNMLIGNLITEQFLKVRDWPFGSALSILLIAPVFLALLFNPREDKPSWVRKSEA